MAGFSENGGKWAYSPSVRLRDGKMTFLSGFFGTFLIYLFRFCGIIFLIVNLSFGGVSKVGFSARLYASAVYYEVPL